LNPRIGGQARERWSGRWSDGASEGDHIIHRNTNNKRTKKYPRGGEETERPGGGGTLAGKNEGPHSNE
jgi:hypothetical protein